MKQRDKVDTGTQWSDQTDTSCHYYGDGHSPHFLKPGLELKLSMLVMEVLMEANSEVDKVMRNILEKEREFHWESKAMKYQMMAQLYKHEQQNC